jgi:hypothetical protein
MDNRKGAGFFEEGPGVLSFTRLASAVLIGVGCLIALFEVNYYMYCVVTGKAYEIHTGLIDSLVMSGLGGKVLQKVFGEKQQNDER